jgi:hypothetical protein
MIKLLISRISLTDEVAMEIVKFPITDCKTEILTYLLETINYSNEQLDFMLNNIFAPANWADEYTLDILVQHSCRLRALGPAEILPSIKDDYDTERWLRPKHKTGLGYIVRRQMRDQSTRILEQLEKYGLIKMGKGSNPYDITVIPPDRASLLMFSEEMGRTCPGWDTDE